MEKQIQKAIQILIEEQDTRLCETLIRDKNVKSPAFAEAAFKQKIFHPNILYQDASEEVRDALIALLDSNQKEEGISEQKKENVWKTNGILLALAAIGDEIVVDFFKKWERDPPVWRKELYVGPAEYALEGGWCIEDGKKKELTFSECYVLEVQKTEKKEIEKEETGILYELCEDKCPYCGSNYLNLLVVDGRDPRLAFLNLGGMIKIKYCTCCLPWEEFIYCKYKEDGESVVINQTHGEGIQADEDCLREAKRHYVLSKRPVSKVYCTAWEKSAIGGKPAFVDDAVYATCPECGKKMQHLAQISGEIWNSEGTEYVQICRDCKIAATMYQQS